MMKNKILVVDDSLLIREELSNALTEAGYEVIAAADGEEGLQKSESIRDLKMVICDINMPKMNGLGVLAGLQAKGLISRFPVLMLTSEVHPSLIARAKACGAKGWIVKPVDCNALVATVNKLVP